jgi:heterodisulfide reductase subunit A
MSDSNGHDRQEPRIGVYVCHCGTNIAGTVDVEALSAAAANLPNVVVARNYKYMCSSIGQELIEKDIAEQGLTRVVVCACSPTLHEKTFRSACQRAGLNPYLFQMANVREHCSWVTTDKAEATEKAHHIMAAAAYRVSRHEPMDERKVTILPSALVIGGGIAGIEAALVMANAGKKVYLVEREASLGGHMAKFDKVFPTLDCAACILQPKMNDAGSHPNIELLTYSEIDSVGGYLGNFTVNVRRKARYVREDLCTGCGECFRVCPVTHVSEFNEGLGTRTAIYRPFPQAVPNVPVLDRLGTPACQAGCPLHQNAQGYVNLIRAGKFKEALDVVLRDNPLPSICGRVCTHPCTAECTRGQVDEPVNIPGLKRFLTDTFPDYQLPKPELEREETVGIVGSGPAGLMCAYELRQKGYKPVIYDALSEPGGMLYWGIPGMRLPREVLSKEIQRLKDTGIELRLNTRVGKDVTLADLASKHKAVFVAVGAHVERKLGVPGEDLEGVWGGIEFLRKVNSDGPFPVGKKVLVIGGGNSALDAARSALRCGADEVTIVYRRTRAEMPADPREVQEAEEEGIGLQFLTAPGQVLGANSRVSGLECIRMKLGEPDSSGRPRPEPIPGSEFRMQCDTVIVTIGQSPDIGGLAVDGGLKTSRWGTLQVDPLTLASEVPGVFAGGDCVTGPDVVVNAMCAGKKAAISIDRYVNGQDMRVGRESEGPYRSTFTVDTDGVLMRKQIPMPTIPLELRRTSFDEVNKGYTVEQAQEEASRCLQCAVCCDCQLCATVCEPGAIDYNMKDEIRELNVGTIIVATGYKPFDASRIAELGWGTLPNVITGLQFEVLCSTSGPTGGKILCENGKPPEALAILHCVGSRDEYYNVHCSRVCCMSSLKFAHLVREKTGAKVYECYIDMRAAGKGFEEFYLRVLDDDVVMIRGRAASITDVPRSPEEYGKLVVNIEDTLLARKRRLPVDMVILSTALEPAEGQLELARMLGISCGVSGFPTERHPKLAPASTMAEGIFLAGCCQFPKDIPDSVAQADAAAGQALALMDQGEVTVEAYTAIVNEDVCSGCRTCVPLCPYGAIDFIEDKKVARVTAALCQACGTCVAACPSSAITGQGYSDEQILAEVTGALRPLDEWAAEKRVPVGAPGGGT